MSEIRRKFRDHDRALKTRPADPVLDEQVRRIVKAREESQGKLASPDPAIRQAEEERIVAGGVAFIMDTSVGGP